MLYSVRFSTIWMLALILAAAFALAEVPEMINYQGRLTDGSGNPLDTIVNITFTIYDDSTGSGSVWTETHDSVIVLDGLFNVSLGTVVAGGIPDTVFNDPDRFMGIRVGGDPELAPRTRLVSVAYAMQANKADSATYAISGPAAGGGWTDDGTIVRLTTQTDDVVIGETTPLTAGTKFEIRGYAGLDTALSRIYFNNANPWEMTYPALEIYNPSYDYVSFQILGAGGIVQNIPTKGLKAGTIANLISPDSSFFDGGPVGIGTTSPQNLLHIVGSESAPLLNIEKNGPGRGVRVYTSSACALWVENSGNHGLRVTNANGDGIHIENSNNDGIHVINAENDGVYIEHALNDGVRVQQADGYAGYFAGSGYFRDNVGIGVTAPSSKLEVAGTIYSTTGGFRFPDGTIQTSAADVGGIHGSGGSGYIPRFSDPTTVHNSQIFQDDNGHVGVGTAAPQGALDVSSTTGAFIVPRMSTAQRDALPAVNGMIIYNISTNQFNFFENGVWVTKAGL